MPPRRRWYHRICLSSSADSDTSDSSESEPSIFLPPANLTNGHDFPSPENLRPAIEDSTPQAFYASTENGRQLFRPPPPPRYMRNHDQIREISEISGVEEEEERDDHNSEVIRKMEVTEEITREKTICPICKDEFNLGEVAGKLGCKHYFCIECIHGWLNFNGNNTCPVCRHQLPPHVNFDYLLPNYYGRVLDSTDSQLVADEETDSEAGYDSALDELESGSGSTNS